MNPCPCNPAHMREIAVRTFPKGVELVTVSMIACDDCEPGRAKLTARQTAPAKASADWKAPRPLMTLSAYLRQLREQRHVQGRWWCVDPGQRERMPRAEWERIEGCAVVPLDVGRAAK